MIQQFSGMAIPVAVPTHRRLMSLGVLSFGLGFARTAPVLQTVSKSIHDAAEQIARSPGYVIRRNLYLRRAAGSRPTLP